MRPKPLRSLAVALAVAAAALGCGRLPTAPDVVPPAAPQAAAPVAEPAPTLAGVVTVAPSGPIAPDTLEAAAPLDGALGGEVKLGRFTVAVPAGAFDGLGVVSIAVPDPARLHCRLEITPESSNAFIVPVRLRIRLDGVAHPERMGILWWNPTMREWERIESRVDRETLTVEAELEHFSEYSVQEVDRAKGGW
uniref:ZU5 domain-containing protein n=1 Tax=Eiseniibacteriota bacterium TaxID=2212470 RepID=A0A832MLV6_UNCEI